MTDQAPTRSSLIARGFASIREEYRYVWQDLSDYFRRYGSWAAVARSPYTHLAIVVTAVSYPLWMEGAWSDVPLEVLPALLGFALAAYALLLAFGDERFRSFLAVRRSTRRPVDPIKDSLLLHVSAIFLQFVVVQIIALVLAIVGHAHPLAALRAATMWPFLMHPLLLAARDAASAFAYFMFVLSITTSANAALDIYHATRWYVEFKVLLEREAQGEAIAEAERPSDRGS